jgi:heat shock protein HtpX
MNFGKTAVLLAVLTAIFVAMGAVVGGRDGMVIAFLVALVMNVITFWASDTIVLKMHGAEEVDQTSAPEYYGLVAELAQRAELPMPRVHIMHAPQPNAFATGRSPEHSAVCASTGLLESLTREEVAGVISHELAHIRNRDTLTMTVAATIGGAVSMLAQYLQFGMLFGHRNNNNVSWPAALVAMLVAPFAATLVQMAISRSREYQADRLGAMICGNPLWLASALAKISVLARQIPNPTAEAIPASAHIFIVNPLSGRGVDNWFSTHPNIENRIAELEQLAREMGVTGSSGTGDFDTRYAPQADTSSSGPWANVPAASPRRRGPWG